MKTTYFALIPCLILLISGQSFGASDCADLFARREKLQFAFDQQRVKTILPSAEIKKSYYPKGKLGYAQVYAANQNWEVVPSEPSTIILDPIQQTVKMAFMRSADDSNSRAHFRVSFPHPFGRVTMTNKINGASYNEGFGLRFDLHSNSDSMQVKLHLAGKNVNWFPDENPGEPVKAYQIVRLRKGLNNVLIRWEDFINSTTAFQLDPERFTIDEMVFEVVSGIDPGTNYQAAELTLVHSIHRDLRPEWFGSKESLEHFRKINQLNNDTRFSSAEEPGEALKFFYEQLTNLGNLDYAFEIIAKGDDAVKAELLRYGYSTVEVGGETTMPERAFFELMQRKHWSEALKIPLEQMPFASYHGRYTHAGQLLAVLRNLPPQKRLMIEAIIRSPTDPIWTDVWMSLFDAPGADAPNAPQWWAEQFRRRKLSTEPASGIDPVSLPNVQPSNPSTQKGVMARFKTWLNR